MVNGVDVWKRSESRHFEFRSRTLDPEKGVIDLVYALDGIELVETLRFPCLQVNDPARRLPAIERALDLLHWVAGISYWKAGCPASMTFNDRSPDAWQAHWLTRLYRRGLAEFAFRNGLNGDQWTLFSSSTEPSDTRPERIGLARRSLLPLGGGKDSLVAWSRLVDAGEQPDTMQIGSSSVIERIGRSLEGHHWVIGRKLDPLLGTLNRQGAWNGHVPVTAINSSIGVLAALCLDYDRVVFANERSADEASLIDGSGREVNHQFSKSFEFEVMLDDWISRYIAPDLKVFSILRRERELAVCREFAGLERFHSLFASCNRNFHLDGPRTERWCGECPKCLFVFLGLAPFLTPHHLQSIFGRDLLADPKRIDGFAGLLALDGVKPLECVGEANEARAAIIALADQPRWSDHVVVLALNERLSGISVPKLNSLCRPGGPHRIPPEWSDAA
jgi:UDP-N-acetyl-alpha-D-muramoyl-L-alanyl-L-glutamate epimerase